MRSEEDVSSTAPDSVRRPTIWKRPHDWSGSSLGRYSWLKMRRISSAVSSPPASVCCWTALENSTCMRRGRSRPYSLLSRYVTPPFPDCEFTRMIAS